MSVLAKDCAFWHKLPRLVLLLFAVSVNSSCFHPAPPETMSVALSEPEAVVVTVDVSGGAPPAPAWNEPETAGRESVAKEPDALAVIEGQSEPSAAVLDPVLPLHVPSTVKVGLASDLSSFFLPCCSDSLLLRVGDSNSRLEVSAGSVGIKVVASTRQVRRGVFRVQVAALKDEAQAKGLATRLRALVSQPADAVFDAGLDLYRVRVGAYATREAAELAQHSLKVKGVESGWIAEEGAGLVDPGFDLIQGSERRRLSGRWLTVQTSSGVFSHGKSRFRGGIMLFINSRGTLNLINQVPLDDYIRGVIPMEMGPGQYPYLEALKAQAIAARTYTLRHLGEFAEEGFDICATPRCQVYGGMVAEHPLSDRAVAETSNQVLVFDNQIVDSLYSASCGGHTENVEVVFPLKHHSYLEGIACPEKGPVSIVGNSVGTSLETAVLRSQLGLQETTLEGQLAELLGQVDTSPLDPRVRSQLGTITNRRDLKRWVAGLFDLRLDPRLLTLKRRDHAKYRKNEPAEWGPSARELFQIFDDPERSEIGVSRERIPLLIADELGLIERHPAHFLDFSATTRLLKVRIAGRQQAVPVADQFATGYLGTNVIDSETRPLTLYAGDRVELWMKQGRVLAVQTVDRGLLSPELSPRTWTRFRSVGQLRSMVAARYPGFQLEEISVVDRGVSGRVAKVELTGAEGTKVEIEGLAIRWTFDLLDTQFTVVRQTNGQGVSGWLFRGSGHGHGVGMCQLGAVAMAERGLDHRQILGHYYTGVRLGRLPELPPRKLESRWSER